MSTREPLQHVLEDKYMAQKISSLSDPGLTSLKALKTLLFSANVLGCLLVAAHLGHAGRDVF